MTNNILYLDTETTGLPPKGAKWREDYEQFPHLVSLSWHYDGKLNDYLIKPEGWTIPQEATNIHGITQEKAEKEGVSQMFVLGEFIGYAGKADKIIGHNLYFDISVIKANLLILNFLLKQVPVKL